MNVSLRRIRVKGSGVFFKKCRGVRNMNRTFGVFCVAATAFLASILAASATYQFEDFENNIGGSWHTNGAVIFSNTTRTNNTWSLSIPVYGSVSNVTSASGSNVWTEFWTIPVPFASGVAGVTCPAIDTNATAQFFVSSNGYWAVYSGNGSGAYLTNLTAVLATRVTDTNTFHKVMVVSDYNTHTFSFFVNGISLAAGLNFMNATVSTSEWMTVDNLGGTVDKICYLDEYSLTNTVAIEGSPTVIAGGGMTEGAAQFYFGTEAPRPVATNAAIAGIDVAWKFVTAGTGSNIVMGGTTTGQIATVKGLLDSNGQINVTDLVGSTNKYFYKIVRQSSVDPSVLVTNAEIYAVYKQTREKNRSYVVGVPVIPIGEDQTLNGPAGAQLAKGLASNDFLTVYSNGVAKLYKCNSATLSWIQDDLNPTPPSGITLTPGMGVLIQTMGDAVDTNTIFAGLLQTNTTSISLTSNSWNVLSWPYEGAGYFAAAISNAVGNSAQSGYLLGDYAWIMQGGSAAPIPARYVNGVWRKYFTTVSGQVLTTVVTLNAGDGVMYKAASNSAAIWQPHQ